MKTIFFSILLFAFSFISLSQSNLTIFNNGDYTFHVMLNGIKQNQFPQKNVTISNVSAGGHALKVVFANGASADIDKKMYLDEPSDIRMSIEFKKGKGKLKIISYEPTKGVQTNSLAFRPNDNAVYGDAQVNNQSTQNQGTVQGTINSNSNSNATTTSNSTSNSTTTVTTTTTNSSNQTPTNGNVNMNVGTTGMNTNSTNGSVNLNVGTNGMNMNVIDPVTGQGVNMNVNMNLNGGTNTNSNIQSNSSSTVTTTSTTVTTTGQSNQTTLPSSQTNSNSTNWNSNTNTNNINGTNWNTNSNSTNSTTSQFNSMKGSARINCTKVLSNFDSYLNEIKELSFESDQVEALEKDLEFTCLTSNQAYKIVEVLTFESNRLDIAKYLSDRMINRDKAGDLLPLFTFDSNKVEYKDYIR
jgi:hypothetical protein